MVMETTLPGRNEFTTYQEARAQGQDLLRRNVVEAASHVLVTEGPEALTVRRIAQALGCSTKIIYTMFEGKDGLANALYLEGCTRLGQAIDMVAPAANPPVYVQELAQAYWRFALAHPSDYGVLFGGAIPRFQPSPGSKQILGQALGAVASILHTYMIQGLLPAQDPVRLARAIWAPLHGVVSLHLLGHFSDEEEATQAFERTVHAVAASLGSHPTPEAS